MSIHIGKIIHELVEKNGIKAKFLAQKINVSESTIYKIYQRETIDIDKLIVLSKVFNENLFIHYLELEPLKSLVGTETKKLHEEIALAKAELIVKTKRIKELESLNQSQHKVIAILGKEAKATKK